MPVFLIVTNQWLSKLLLLYSSQFGIYIMPQLDKLESKIAYIQFGMEFYS